MVGVVCSATRSIPPWGIWEVFQLLIWQMRKWRPREGGDLSKVFFSGILLLCCSCVKITLCPLSFPNTGHVSPPPFPKWKRHRMTSVHRKAVKFCPRCPRASDYSAWNIGKAHVSSSGIAVASTLWGISPRSKKGPQALRLPCQHLIWGLPAGGSLGLLCPSTRGSRGCTWTWLGLTRLSQETFSFTLLTGVHSTSLSAGAGSESHFCFHSSIKVMITELHVASLQRSLD